MSFNRFATSEPRWWCALAGFVALFAGGACGSNAAKSDGAAPGGAGGLEAKGGDGGGGCGHDQHDCARDGAIADAHPDGAVAACSPPSSGIPDGGARCAVTCDPARPDGGVCYGVPSYNAANTSMQIWVEDASAPGGGWRVSLATPVVVTVGGHSYEDRADGLVGQGGNGIFGDLFVARDGQAKWTGFHFEGFARYLGNRVWDWNATVTVSRSGGAAPVTTGRHYTITRSSPACNASAVYIFVADDPPRTCAFDVDLLSFAVPST